MSTTPSPMMRALAAAVRGNVPALVMGDPGQAKTALIEATGSAWGRHVETISASSREAVDFMGLPMEDGGRVVYSPLSWALRLNEADTGLLVVDEITTAQSTFKAFLRIVQERYVGELKLADTVSIVALANPPEIAVDGVDLPAPVANRFLHLDWHFDSELWLEGVGTAFTHQSLPDPDDYLFTGDAAEQRAKVAAAVTSFLKSRPSLINKVPSDPESQSKPWPSARSWTNAIDALAWLDPSDEDARDLILKGCVGEGAWLEYVSWLASADLVDPSLVLDNPRIVDWATARPDKVFATLQGVRDVVLVRDTHEAWLAGMNVLTVVANANRPDVALPAVRALLNSRHADKGVPAAARAAFADVLQRSGRLAKVS